MWFVAAAVLLALCESPVVALEFRDRATGIPQLGRRQLSVPDDPHALRCGGSGDVATDTNDVVSLFQFISTVCCDQLGEDALTVEGHPVLPGTNVPTANLRAPGTCNTAGEPQSPCTHVGLSPHLETHSSQCVDSTCSVGSDSLRDRHCRLCVRRRACDECMHGRQRRKLARWISWSCVWADAIQRGTSVQCAV